MKYRLAKISDLNAIANIHYDVRESYKVGFFSKSGISFIKKYYSIVLNDPNSVVICAENSDGIIQGFCSATLDINAQMFNLRRHKWILAFSAIPSIIKNPSLFKDLYDRYKLKDNTDKKIISFGGARSEYWAWKSTNQDSVSSVEMYFAKLNILKALGVKDLFGEVDIINKKILRFQLANGAEIIERIVLEDGRERVFLKTPLITWKK
jgi:hypothetical protein